MDLTKLEGLLESIEVESHLPSPSHANLARLISMFNREVIDLFKELHTPKPSKNQEEPVLETHDSLQVEIAHQKEEKPEAKHPGKPKGHKALSKKS